MIVSPELGKIIYHYSENFNMYHVRDLSMHACHAGVGIKTENLIQFLECIQSNNVMFPFFNLIFLHFFGSVS